MKLFLFIILILPLPVSIKAQSPLFDWAKSFGGTVSDIGFSVKTDAAGNVYTTGFFTGNVDFDPGPGVFTMGSGGSPDVFIVKQASNGNFIWAKQFEGPGANDAAVCYSIFIDPAGNIYLTGNFDGTVDFDPGPAQFNMQVVNTGNFREIFVVKLDALGNFIWAKQFGGPGASGLFSSSVVVDPSGNIYTTGFISGDADFDPGPGIFNLNTQFSNLQNVFIAKLNSAGDFIWAKQIGDTRDQCWAFGLALDQSGNIYAAGAYGASFSPVGTVDFDPGPGLFELTVPSGNTNAFVLELDPLGDFKKVTSLDLATNDYARSITIDVNNNVYYSGYFSVNNSDIFFSKIGAPGNTSWTKILGGPGHEESHSISTDASGDIYLSGFFEQTVILDPVSPKFDLVSAGNSDFFLLRTNSNGDFIWARTFGGTATDAAYSSSADMMGNVFVTGIFNGQAEFDPGPANYLLNSNGGNDVFVLKIGTCPTSTSMITNTICAGQNFAGYTKSGTYVDTLLNSLGCDSIRTIKLTVNPLPKPDLGPDKNLCLGDTLKLGPGTYTSYLWQDGSALNQFTVTKAGLYSVTVLNSCGTASDEVMVISGNCDIYFPSAFTPNNDGKNEIYKVLTFFNLENFHFTIFNRWGQKVFETKDQTKGWNGKLNGMVLDTSVFAWICEYKKPGSSELIQLKGSFTLIK